MVPNFNVPSGGYTLLDVTDGYTPDTNNPSSVYGVRLYPNGIPAGTPAAGPIGIRSPDGTSAYTPNPVSGITASFGYKYGTTAVVITIDNYFYFKVTYPTADGKNGKFTTPLLGFPIWSTPANSSWVYDYANNSMTKTN